MSSHHYQPYYITQRTASKHKYDESNCFGWRAVRQLTLHAHTTTPGGSTQVNWPRGAKEPALEILRLAPPVYDPRPDVALTNVSNRGL
jgi:hypothetical protein